MNSRWNLNASLSRLSWLRGLMPDAGRLLGTIRRERSHRPHLETLESRITPTGQLQYHAADATPLTLRLVGDQLQIVDSNDPFHLLATQALADTGHVLIAGDGYDVDLTIDDSMPQLEVGIFFDGGSGSNTLFGPGYDVDWHVTGPNAGDLRGPGYVSFYGVENLAGAADNEDTFYFGPAGTLSGVVEGGDRGFDSVVLDGGTFDVVRYKAFGPDSGALHRDADVITYDGMEPVTDNTNTTNRVFDGEPSIATQVRLFRRASDNMLTIESDDDLHAFESVSFPDPSGSLTISLGFNAKGTDEHIHVDTLGACDFSLILDTGSTNANNDGEDTILFRGDITLQNGHGLEATAETITINNGVSLSTSDAAGTAGPITLTGWDVTLETNARLLAEGSTVATSGTIIIDAIDRNAYFTPFVNVDKSSVSITMKSGAQLKGGDVFMNAVADNQHILSLDEYTEMSTVPKLGLVLTDIIAQAIEGILQIGAGVSYSEADANITVETGTVISARNLIARSSANASAVTAPITFLVGPAVGIALTDAHVTVKGSVTTTENATFQSGVDHIVNVFSDTSGLKGAAAALAVSVVDSDATVHVEDTSTLTIGGDLNVLAATTDRNRTSARSAANTDGSVGISIALSIEHGDTEAYLDGAADVVGDIVMGATQQRLPVPQSKLFVIPNWTSGTSAQAGVGVNTTGDFLDDQKALAIGKITGPIKNKVITKITGEAPTPDKPPLPVSVAAAIAIAIDTNNATTRIGDSNTDGDNLNGNVEADGSIRFTSRIINRPDVTASSSATFDSTIPPSPGGSPSNENNKFAGSFAVPVGIYTNSARSIIGEGAAVDAKQQLSLTADALNDYAFMYGVNLITPFLEAPKYTSDQGTQPVAFNDIVEFKEETGGAQGQAGDWYRYIGPDRTIDLSKENFLNTASWIDLGGRVGKTAKGFIGNLTSYLNDNFGLEANAVDTWSQAVAGGDTDVAVAGAVAFVRLDHTAEAIIKKSAQINQDITLRTSTQDVSLNATSANDAVNFGGNIKLPGLTGNTREFKINVNKPGAGSSTNDGKGAVGFTFQFYHYVNNVTAKIEDDVHLYGSSLEVDAENRVMSIVVGASGGKSNNVAFNGAIGANLIESNTIAHIENGATINVGANSVADSAANGASVFVEATDQTYAIIILGGVAISDHVGIGATVGVNTVERHTEAIIGNQADDAANDTRGSFTSAEDVKVNASNSGFIGAFTVSGSATSTESNNATSTGLNKNDGSGSVDDPGKLPNNQKSYDSVIKELKMKFGETSAQSDTGAGTQKGKAGVAISGAVSIDVVDDNARAYVRNTGAFTVTNGTLDLHAENSTSIGSLAGAVALALGTGGGLNAGIAGAVGVDIMTGTTDAFVDGATSIDTDGLTMNADRNGFVVSITAGVSGAVGKQGIAIAGSVAVLRTTNTTETALRNTNGTVNGPVTLHAHDDTNLILISGSGGFGGQAGVGAGVSFAEIENTVRSEINNVQGGANNFKHTGNVDLEATTDGDIVVVAASAGVGTGGSSGGGAGTFAMNFIDSTIEAKIVNAHTTTDSTGNIRLFAKDDSFIVALAGAVGVGNSGAVGAALGYNEITSNIGAIVENATLNTTGSVSLEAKSEAVIGGVAVGVAVSTGSGFALEGSVEVNKIIGSVDAHILDSTVHAGGAVSLDSSENSTLVSIAGGVAVSVSGSAGVGASISYNRISVGVAAYIDGSTVDSANGSISLNAKSTPLLVAIGAAGGGGKDIGGAGTLTINSIANTLDAHIIDSTISALGDVAVSASESAAMYVVALAGAGAPNGGSIGASIAYNYVGGPEPADPNVISYDDGAVEGTKNAHVQDSDTNLTSSVFAYINNSDVTAGARVLVLGGFAEPTVLANPGPTVTIDPTNITVTGDVITLGAPHGLSLGQEVVYHSATPIGGLVDGHTYYVIPVSATKLKLASTVANAAARVAIDLTSAGGAGQTLTNADAAGVKSFIPAGVQVEVAPGTDIVPPPADNDGRLTLTSSASSFSVTGGNAMTGLFGSAPTTTANSIRGSAAANLTIGAGNDTLNLSANGVAFSITLTHGDYIPDTLAQEIESKIRAALPGAANELTFDDAHGLSNAQEVVYHSNGQPAIPGLTDGQTYFVIVVDSNSIKLAATSAAAAANNPIPLGPILGGVLVHHIVPLVSASTITFGSAAVATGAAGADQISFTTSHGLLPGAAVIYRANGGTAVGGLIDGATYYVIFIDSTHIQLAASLEDANRGIPVALTGAGVGTSHSLISRVESNLASDNKTINPATDVTLTDNAIRFGAAHGLNTGDEVKYDTGGNTAVGGLVNGAYYFVIRVDDFTIKLASTKENAVDKLALSLISTGSGTGHTLRKLDFTNSVTVTPGGDDLVDNNKLVFADGHGFTNNQRVVYRKGDSGNQAIGGLTDNGVYFVKFIDADTIQLATTAGGSAINLSAGDGSGHSLTPLEAADTFAATDVAVINALADQIAFPSDHGLHTGDAVVYRNGGGTSIGGLKDGDTYFVIKINDTHIKLASTQKDANLATPKPIFLTTLGTGSSHTLIIKPTQVSINGISVALPVSIGGQITSITAAGSGGKSLGGAGAVALNFVRMKVDAHISNATGAKNVQAGSHVVVAATDTSEIFSGTGSIALSLNGGVAVNASVGVNDIRSSVNAYIEGAKVASTSGDVTVSAEETAQIVNVVIGGAAAGGQGLAFGGSFAINLIHNTVDARIASNVTSGAADVDASGSVSVLARDTASIATLAGNIAFTIGGPAAVGVAFAVNEVNDSVKAIVDGSTVTATTGDIILDATFAKPSHLPAGLDVQIAAMAVSGGGAQNIAGAGSVSLNWVRNTVEAKIANVTNVGAGNEISAGDDIKISASDDSTISSLAGAVAIAGIGASGASGAIGASVSYNYLGGDPNDPNSTNNNVVRAAIENVAGGIGADEIDIHARYNGQINNITVAGAAAGNFALGGAVSINKIRNLTDAHVVSSLDIHTLNAGSSSFRIRAEDTSVIQILAGGVGLALDFTAGLAIAAGVSVAVNDIDNTIQAYVDNGKVDADGGVTIEAISDATIKALTLGIAVGASAGSGGFAGSGAGAGSGNEINNTVQAYVANSPGASNKGVYADGNILIRADDTAGIYAIAGGLGVAVGVGGYGSAAATVGVGVADNDIENTVKAYVSGSTVSATTADVEISALEAATVFAVCVGGAVAVAGGGLGAASGAGAGSNAINKIKNSVKAYADAASINTTTSGNVKLLAHDSATIKATSVAASVAIAASGVGTASIAIGAGLADNTIENTIEAYSQSSTLTSAGGIQIEATTTADITAASAAASVSAAVSIAGLALSGAGANSNNAVDNTINAYIQGASAASKSTINAVGNIEVSASETATINSKVVAISASGAVAGGSIGISIADNEISSTITAYVNNANITSTGGDVIVTATTTDSVESLSVATSVAVAIGGAGAGADATSKVNPTVVAKVMAGATLHSGDDVSILAMTNNNAAADTYGAALGFVAIGTSTTSVEANGSVRAFMEGIVTGADDVLVQALATQSADAVAVALAGGIVSGAGAQADAEIAPTVEAYTSKNITASNAVTVTASLTPNADAESVGVAVAEYVGVGASIANATVNPTVSAHVGGTGVTMNALSLTVLATQVLPGGGDTAHAFAVGASGGILAGISASEANAVNGPDIDQAQYSSYVADNTTLNITGATAVNATTNSKQYASSDNFNAGALAAGAGASFANSNTLTEAYLGANVQLTGGSLSVAATGIDNNMSQVLAGSVGLVSGAGAKADTDTVSTTTAKIKNGDGVKKINLTGTGSGVLAIGADHTAKFNAEVLTFAGGALAGSGAETFHDVNSTVEAAVGNNAVLWAKSINIGAANHISKPALPDHENALDPDKTGPNILGATAGLVSGAGAASDVDITFNTLVTIGDNATLEVKGNPSSPGLMSLHALNDIVATDKVTLGTGGALSGAGASSRIETDADLARVQIGTGADLSSIGGITMAARGQGTVFTGVAVDTFGVGTVAVAEAKTDIRPTNEVAIGTNATVHAEGDLNISAGTDTDFNRDQYTITARVDTFAGSAIPISSVDAVARLIQTNTITVASGAVLETARNANLHAERFGFATMVGHAKATSWVSAVQDAINGQSFEEGEVDTAAYAKVQIDGTLRTGINRQKTLILDSWNSHPPSGPPTVSASTQTGGITYNVTQELLVSTLQKELDNAIYQLSVFQNSGNTTLISFYTSEVNRLQAELEALGLLDHPTAPNGTPPPQANQQYVLTVNVDDIWAQAGVIDIRTDVLLGSGLFDSPGDAKVIIHNSTPAYLNIHRITIPQTNGGVFFNGNPVSDALVDDINVFEGLTPITLPNFQPFPLPGAGLPPVIEIINTFDPRVYSDPLFPDDVYPAPDITVTGSFEGTFLRGIDNLGGNVDLIIQNGKGNILINAPVRAKNLSVVTGGDVFINGVTSYSIGGEALSHWKPVSDLTQAGNAADSASVLAAIGNVLNAPLGSNSSVQIATVDHGVQPASNVVNGVPTGIHYAQGISLPYATGGTFTLTFNGQTTAPIPYNVTAGGLKNALDNLPGSEIFSVTGNGTRGTPFIATVTNNFNEYAQMSANVANLIGYVSLYGDRIFITGEYLNINGVMQSGKPDYVLDIGQANISDATEAEISQIEQAGGTTIVTLQTASNPDFLVRYDPVLNRIQVEELQVSGGYIEMHGHVINTGKGEIRVLGGFGNITVHNYTPYDLVLKRLDASKRGAGKLVLNDTSRGASYVTLFEKAGGTVTKTVDPGTGAAPTISTVGNDSTYAPLSGYRYGWSISQEQFTRKFKEEKSSTWLGIDAFAVDPPDEYWDSIERVGQPILVGEGPYYYTDNALTGTNYTFLHESTTLAKNNFVTNQHTSSTWYGKKTYYATYVEEERSLELYTHTIKADRDINVKFLGYDEGAITVTSEAGILIDGPIQNPSGVITLTAAQEIEQLRDTATVGGRRLVISAQTGIGVLTPLNTLAADTPTFDFTSVKNLTSVFPTETVKLAAGYAGGGVPGSIYRYKGATAPLDLGVQNYANTALWELVTGSSTFKYTSDASKLRIVAGNQVLVNSGHTAGGDVGSVYRYLGSPALVDLSVQNFNNGALWQKVQFLPSFKATTTAGIIQINQTAGDLPVDQVRAGLGADITLTAQGGIRVAELTSGNFASGAIGNATLAGSIDLTASNGAIGDAAHPVTLFSGTLQKDTVSLFAQDSIYVREGVFSAGIKANNPAAGNLQLKRAVSQSSTGIVSIEVPDGALIDANNSQVVDQRTVDELATGLWRDLQLTDETPLVTDDTVKLAAGYAGGGTPGAVYRYLGQPANVILGTQDYSNGAVWQLTTDVFAKFSTDGSGADKVNDTITSFIGHKNEEYQTYWKYRTQQAQADQVGLVTATVYYVIVDPTDSTRILLAATPAAAAAGTPILNLTQSPTLGADHHLQFVPAANLNSTGPIVGSGVLFTFDSIADVSSSLDTIALGAGHGLATGDAVVYTRVLNFEYDGNYHVKLSPAEEAFYRTQLNYDDAAIITLENKRTGEYHDLHTRYGSVGNTFNPNFNYVLTPAEENALRGSIKVWTVVELLNTVSSGLLKPTASTQVNIEDPNIIGHDVNIVASRGIGKTGGQVFIDLVNRPKPIQLTLDERVAFAAADRIDVSYLAGDAVTAFVTFTDNGAQDTITRVDGGNWINDGLKAGMTIEVAANSSNATEKGTAYQIADVTADVLTLTATAQLANDPLKTATITPVVLDARTPQALFLPLTFTYASSQGQTNVSPGDTVKVAFGHANGGDEGFVYRYLGVAASIDLAHEDFSVTSLWQKISAVDFFDNGAQPDTISRNDGGSWLDDGFRVNMKITVGGISGNTTGAGQFYTIAAVTDGVITLIPGDSLVTEAGAQVNILGPAPTITAIVIDLRDDVNLNATGKIDARGGLLNGSNQMYFQQGVNVYLGSGAPAGGAEVSLNLNQVLAGDEVRIKSRPGIFNAAAAGAPNIISSDMILEAGRDAIGTAAKPILIQPYAGATLTARAEDDVRISQHNASSTAGTMFIETVSSDTGGVYLLADGSIVDALNSGTPKIGAGIIDLIAGGAIGELADFLETNLTPSGTLTALATGDIRLHETSGNMGVDFIKTTGGDVYLRASGSIVDAATAAHDNSGDDSRPAVDVVGNNITLTSDFGAIGISGNDLDIDTRFGGAQDGTLTSTSFLGQNLIELFGDLHIFEVRTAFPFIGDSYTAFIAASVGSILNGKSSGHNVLSGKTYLFARDNIGAANKPLTTAVGVLQGESTLGSTWVDNTGALAMDAVVENATTSALAGGMIHINASSPVTVVLDAIAETGEIVIVAMDDAQDGNDPANDDVPDHLTVASGVTIWSKQSLVKLLGGDNVTIQAGATVKAATSILIQGDWQGDKDGNEPPAVHPNADPGVGTVITILGTVNAPEITVKGEVDRDTIDIDMTDPTSSFIGHATVLGGDAADITRVHNLNDRAQSMDVDGQQGADTYVATIRGGSTQYLVNIFDTGTDAGADQLQQPFGAVNGTDDSMVVPAGTFRTGQAVMYHGPGTADEVLVEKRLYFIVVDSANPTKIHLAATYTDAVAPTPVVLDLAGVSGGGHSLSLIDALTVYGTAAADDFLLRASKHEFVDGGVAFVAAIHGQPVSKAERVNYNKNLENLVLDTLAGDDHATIDDNWTLTRMYGGAGADTFQVGQIYKSERDLANANVAFPDEFTTIVTTRGFLSNGVSYDTAIRGGADGDTFGVFHNSVPIGLFGDGGDDLFVIRAFALEGSQESSIAGSAGADFVEYVLNAPVNIVGGDGTDTVRIIGTEFGDEFVVTAAQLFGAGVSVNYTQIEILEVDAAEGNDTFYVLSTDPTVETRLFGGLGSDVFSIGGDVPDIFSGLTVIFPATPGNHTMDGIADDLLVLNGASSPGYTLVLPDPVLLPGETNVLPAVDDILNYVGTGDPLALATLTIDGSNLAAVGITNPLVDHILNPAIELIGKTIEVSSGPGLGRFWRILAAVQVPSTNNWTLTVQNVAQPSPLWGLPDNTSKYAITHLSPNFFVNEADAVDYATVYNDAAPGQVDGRLVDHDHATDAQGNSIVTSTMLTGLTMGTGIKSTNLENLDILLGRGNDIFTVRGTAKGTATKVSANDGEDLVNVGSTLAENNGNLDFVQGRLLVLSGANPDAAHPDRIYVNDFAKIGRANVVITPTQVIHFDLPTSFVPSPPIANFDPPRPTFAGMDYTGATEILRMDGNDDVNIFNVQPSFDTEFFIYGNLPPSGVPLAGGGDYLMLDTQSTGTTGRRLHITALGQGFWSFSSAHKHVNFVSIERFNHVATYAVANAGRTPLVKVFDAETNELQFEVRPYEAFFRGGVRAAIGDVNFDGLPDLIVAPGVGRTTTVKIYNGSPDAAANYPHALLTAFNVFPNSFKGGVNLAVGDLNRDGANELVVSADRGWYPRIAVFDGKQVVATHSMLVTPFNAFSRKFRGGVSVAVGDIDLDGFDEIIAGSGSGTSATVNIFSFAKLHGENPPASRTFLPFGKGVLGGVFVAAGDVNGDGIRDVTASAGKGGLPRVITFNGAGLMKGAGLPAALQTFLPFPNSTRTGVRVVAKPTDGGNPGFVERINLFVAPGPDGGPNSKKVRLAQFLGAGLNPQVVERLFEAATFNGIFLG